MAYVSISVEGGLFPSDLLDRIAVGGQFVWSLSAEWRAIQFIVLPGP